MKKPGELKSWGMGLTIVKMAAEAHGGHVELISDDERGTTFCLMLAKYSNKPEKVRSKLELPGLNHTFFSAEVSVPGVPLMRMIGNQWSLPSLLPKDFQRRTLYYSKAVPQPNY